MLDFFHFYYVLCFCVCAHVCTCMWNTDQCWVSSFFTLLRQGRLLDLEITDWLDWLANELPESFCLLFPCLGTRAYMAAGEQTQVLIYLLCLLPSSSLHSVDASEAVTSGNVFGSNKIRSFQNNTQLNSGSSFVLRSLFPTSSQTLARQRLCLSPPFTMVLTAPRPGSGTQQWHNHCFVTSHVWWFE